MKSHTPRRFLKISAPNRGVAIEARFSGTQASERIRVVPWKPGGATPTIRTGWLLNVTVRPTVSGAPAKRRCHNS